MIASVAGVVRSIRLDSVVIEVNGFGMLVFATPSTLAGLRAGVTAELATSLVVREDSLTLFGFATDDERDVFEIVQTVSGIGPRLAVAMLAVHSPDDLRRAVAAQDLAALQKVPGIGRKGAQRIVLELEGRLGAAHGLAGVPVPTSVPDRRVDVIDALVGLGWTARAAEDAVASVLEGSSEPVAAADVPQLLRSALRSLGGGRG